MKGFAGTVFDRLDDLLSLLICWQMSNKEESYMFRKTALALALTSSLAAGNAIALGLGDIELKSALNQPFNAEVDLLSATEDELNELKVLLGSRQAFSSAGIDRSGFLTRLKFTVTQNNANQPIIRITSREPVTEPFLDFLLEVAWSKGKLLREFTVLVDPPVTMAAAPVTLQAPSIRPVTPVAQPVEKPVVAAQPVQAPVAAPVANPVSQVQNTAILPALAKDPSEYGPTQRNETLWAIAERVRPDTDVSMEQTMMGLLRANPEAFVNNNINNLKTGHVLRVPDRDDLTSITRAQASRQARDQYNAWRQARSGAASSTTGQSAAADNTPVDTEAPATESKLQLVAPDLNEANTGTVDQAGGEPGDEVNTLKRDLVLANEALEAQRSESQEMANRLSVLEEQIQNMQRLIQLKDDELARLQSQAGSDVPATAAAMAENTLDTDASNADAAADSGMQAEPDAAENIDVIGAGQIPEPAEAENVPATDIEVPAEDSTVASETDEAVSQPPAATETGVASLLKYIEPVMQNPLWLGAGAAVLALLAFFGLRGRGSTDSEFQESILRPSADGTDDQTDFSETQTHDSALNDSSLLSEFAVSDMAVEADGGEANPMAEADVYLAYGRFQQAEELLKEALAAEPDNEELNLKLLDVYQASGNVESFDSHASDLFANLGDRENPVWQKVAEMGLAVNPDNPLYHPDGVAPVTSETADTFSADSAVEDFDTNEPTVTFDQAPGTDTDIQEQADLEAVPDNTIDFDLESFNMDAASDSTEADMHADGELTNLDEISTKLDLARAYIDMGDPEGARNILSEVIEEGNDDQKNEANGILERLAS